MARCIFSFLTLTIFLFFTGCFFPIQEKEKPSGQNDKSSDGLVKNYYPDGKIKAEVTMKDKKRHGLARSYYPSGVVRQEIDYLNNVKHGVARTNYETGKPYQITRYVEGKMEGVREKYRQNGDLMSEAPYYNDLPCAGLKEYLLNGELKMGYPSINITEENNLEKDYTYTLYISLDEKARNQKFYVGELDENGCLGPDVFVMKEQKPGLLAIKFDVIPGTYVKEDLNFIVTFETLQGNTAFVQRRHRLYVENPSG
jgi:hypothetical protein